MLGYRDSGMKDSPANEDPASFHQADFDEAVGRLVEVIRRTRPQVIITYNDDQQGYPHPDHLKVHDISVPAFDRAGDPAWYPDLGQPWQPSKLYYTVWSRRRLLAVHEALLALRGASPFDEAWFERPDQDGRITTQVPVGDHMWARSGALRAARHPGRPERGVLVRPVRPGAGGRLPLRGLDPGPLASSGSRRRASSRTTCSRACGCRCGSDGPDASRRAPSSTGWSWARRTRS